MPARALLADCVASRTFSTNFQPGAGLARGVKLDHRHPGGNAKGSADLALWMAISASSRIRVGIDGAIAIHQDLSGSSMKKIDDTRL